MARLERQLIRWMKRVEKVLIRVVVLGVLSLVILQMALNLASDPLNFYTTLAQKIEAPALSPVESAWQPNLVLSLAGGNSPDLKILVNDEPAGSLANGRVELKVKSGDKLAVDARKIAGKNLRLTVIGVDENFSYPKLNQTWLLRGSILDLGVVK